MRIIWNERGDTLIEVTMALAIMAAVIVGATSVAAQAFRLGNTARERTQLVNAAIEQAEALRSFRDNHAWSEFLTGNAAGAGHFEGVKCIGLVSCGLPSLAGKHCFSMNIANGEWAPQAALADQTNNVVPPLAEVEIYEPPPSSSANCVVLLEVHYGSPSISSTEWQEGFLTVELVNPDYSGPYAGVCKP